MRHVDRAWRVLRRLNYKDWQFHVVPVGNGACALQVAFAAPDTDVPIQIAEQRGRKWLLSEHMTDSEIVQTAFMAVLAAEEHEARELFTLDGIAVLGPHFDLGKLAALYRVGAVTTDERPAVTS